MIGAIIAAGKARKWSLLGR